MILHTHSTEFIYNIYVFVLPIAHNKKNPDLKETKLEKSKKKTEEETVWRKLTKKLRIPCVDSQDRELSWLGCTTQSTNLVRYFHIVWYPVRRTTEKCSWYVSSHWYSCLTLNSEHLVGFCRDSYCANSDTEVTVKRNSHNARGY